MYELLQNFLKRPEPFEKTTTKELWTRPHIARQMLRYHLDETTELASRTPDEIESIVNWIDSHLELSGKRLCDLGCGPGLYAECFAGKGAQVTALDFSSTSINYAIQQAQRKGLPIEYFERDYINDPLPTGFDIVTLIYFDYCTLSPESRKVLLDKVAHMLVTGGHFALDVAGVGAFANRRSGTVMEQNLMNSFWSEHEYIGLQRTFIYPESLLSLDRYLILQETESWECFNWLQHFTPELIAEELENSGFEVGFMAGSLSGEFLAAGGESIGVIARKR